jgi:hypothetical protein
VIDQRGHAGPERVHGGGADEDGVEWDGGVRKFGYDEWGFE